VDVADLDADPLGQLSAWLDAARAAGQPMPEAMTIASAASDAVPSARLVVLRGLRRGLVFFTDCDSDKGAELAANPRAAAVLHRLVPVHPQVRVAGPVDPVSEDEADEYWRTRVPAARLGAAAWRQSRVVADRWSWKCRSRTCGSATPAVPVFLVRGAGAASGCCPPGLSSGRNHRMACTTGSATAREAARLHPGGLLCGQCAASAAARSGARRTRWIRVSLPDATFEVGVRDGLVVEAAPAPGGVPAGTSGR